MAHLTPQTKSLAPAGSHGKRLPEWYLLVAWVGSFLGFMIWLRNDIYWQDLLIFIAIYVLCLPVIFPSTKPNHLAWLGGPISGLICGMQIIDMVFDILILRDRSVTDGVGELSARRVAFLYYRAVVNASHVNAALGVIILVAFLGSLVGISRSTPEVLKQWMLIGACMCVGTGGYLTCVVTRYQNIRVAEAFDASLFDGWAEVVAARLVLYASLFASIPFMFRISTTPCEGDAWHQLTGKVRKE